MAHHIFIHFILTVNHFLLGADQPSILLSHSRPCVGERSQLSVSQAGLASCQPHRSSELPPEGRGALADPLPTPTAHPSYVTCYCVPIPRDALCSRRMNGTDIFQRTDGYNGGGQSAYLNPTWKNGMPAFRRECLL